LQGFQLLAKGIGKQIGHDADELAHLDEQALQIDDGGKHAPGVLAVNLIRQLDRLLAGCAGGGAANRGRRTTPPAW
jgi:hypothetical protein